MSDIINLLPDHIANQIAAGEVIQRPASGVKELLENAIDAGATAIKVIIKDAGKQLVQVIDNGCGMSETDARMSFERHATSKISKPEDLFAIRTMGFRGEALASIAAIAQVEMKTKRIGDELGTHLIVEGSEVKSQQSCQCPEGTAITVKNLFFNVPARRNFLKSTPVEMRHILDEFQRIAIAHPKIGFDLHHNDSAIFCLAPANLKQRIVSIFGKNYNQRLVPVGEATDIIKITGFVGKPEFAKKTRGEQFFFVNNRFIKSPYFHHAVVGAYQQILAQGSHPLYVVFMDLDPAKIDVNIHPTKQEVKFEEEKVIYAIHNFFQERDFVQVDSPIFTGNAAEGTSTLFETDFYGQPAYLAQTGQLYSEAAIMSLGKIYTFGPTFRAEKSKTRRHLSEFWMMEPEMAFYDAAMNMDLIEALLKYVIKSVLEKCRQELKILERDTTTFEKLLNSQFPRMTYTDAVAIIKGEKDINGQNALKLLEGDLVAVKKLIAEKQTEVLEREERIKKGGMKKGEVNFNLNKVGMLKAEIRELKDKEENIPQWIGSANKFEFGNDFGGSDETVLTRLFDVPIMVYNWPREIKAFYMKDVEEDSRFVQAVDVLAPEGFGEIVGGSVREDDKDKLIEKIKAHKLPIDAFEWYIDLRRFGTIPHAGFGLGLERFITWIANLSHIRESIPFPRMYGRLFP